MDALTVRMYNVRFGDAILISIPDAENGMPKMRHILVDVGNALTKEGGKDFVFKPVIEDIANTIGDASIDLYVMTHEHLDHIQGLFYGEEKERLPRLPVKSAWLPASSEPGYYDKDWPETDEDGKSSGYTQKTFRDAGVELLDNRTFRCSQEKRRRTPAGKDASDAAQ